MGQEVKSAGTRPRLTMLDFLVFRLGGVAGVTRRIVYRQQGLFTMNDVRTELATRYPRLVPATNQFEGVIEQMEKRGQIVCVFSDANAKTYKVNHRRRCKVQYRSLRGKQMKFDFFHK